MNILLRFSLILIALCCMNAAKAQQNKKKKKKTTSTEVQPPPDTTSKAKVDDAPKSKRVSTNFDSSGYNTLSVRLIHKSDIMYKMSVWRKLDLREKCNLPLFSKDGWITKHLIEGVQAGLLQPYKSDSLSEILTKEEFLEKIKEPSEAPSDQPAAQPGEPDPFAAPGAGGSSAPSGPTVSYYQAKQLYIMVFKEDLVFDKQRSRHYYDIQTVTLYLPAELNTLKGTEVELATFKYKDMIKLFGQNTLAKWYNSQNRAEDKKLSDAFDLRLFCSKIIKMSNPKDEMLQDIQAYNTSNKALLIASQRIEQELVTKENEVWDY